MAGFKSENIKLFLPLSFLAQGSSFKQFRLELLKADLHDFILIPFKDDVDDGSIGLYFGLCPGTLLPALLPKQFSVSGDTEPLLSDLLLLVVDSG